MIGKLKGLVDGFGDDFVHIDVRRRRLRGVLLEQDHGGAAAGRGMRRSSMSR